MNSLMLMGCVLLGIAGFVSGQEIESLNTQPTGNLVCYDCNPVRDAGGCQDPQTAENPPRTTTCQNAQNGTAICVSAFLNYVGNGTLTGTYRICTKKPNDVANLCDWYKEERHSNGSLIAEVKNCVACQESRCNIHKFNADGTSNAEANLSSAFVLFFNAIIVYLSLQ